VSPEAGPEPRRVRTVDDAATFRAFAHPLRMRLLGALRLEGPATASALGRRLGESSGSTSYHLRQLARYGFVAEDEDQPSRRERRWRALHARTAWSSETFLHDPAAVEAEDALAARQVETAARVAADWRQRRLTATPARVAAATFSDYEPRLTPEALQALTREVTALVDRYEDACAGDPAAERIHLYVQAVPGVDLDVLVPPASGDPESGDPESGQDAP
jgi:DNA-binding transcriptional ArsR family regulator